MSRISVGIQNDIPSLEREWANCSQRLQAIDQQITTLDDTIGRSYPSGQRDYLYNRYRKLINEYNSVRDMMYPIEDRLIDLGAPGWVSRRGHL